MQDAYNTREGEVGKKNYKEEELIDWVHVQRDDSAKVVDDARRRSATCAR